MVENYFKTSDAPAGVAHLIERWPVNRKVTSLIPRQGMCLGCRARSCEKSLPTSLPISLKIN